MWKLSNSRVIDLSSPKLMAIVNVTPDSFSDGGRHFTIEAALRAARGFVEQGASVLDIGGESTRPGSEAVDGAEQIRRTEPLIRALRDDALFDRIAISIDTTRAEVAEAAIKAGADAVNDVSGLQDEPREMMELLTRSGAGYVLMHRLYAPAKDSYSDKYARGPEYGDVVRAVREFLAEKLRLLMAAGIGEEKVILDPGLGFGKTVEQNLALIHGTPEILSLGRPVVSGLSRKSFVGRHFLGRDSDPAERLEGTLALSAEHVRYGARLLRVHDVREHANLVESSKTPRKPGANPPGKQSI